MRELWWIALSSFRETVRDKILYTLVFFALLLVAFSRLLGDWSVYDRDVVVVGFSLGVMSLGGLALAIFVGVGLIQKEIQRKTVLTLLSKPVRRSQLLVGKYLGLSMVLALDVAVMLAALWIVLKSGGSAFRPGLLLAGYETFLEMAVVTAVALLFSSFSTPVVSSLLTFAVFLASHLSGGILQYMETMRRASQRIAGSVPASPAMEWAARIAHWVLPDLEVFDVRTQVAHGLPIPHGHLLWSTVHCVGWTGLLLALSCLWFSRRDFV